MMKNILTIIFLLSSSIFLFSQEREYLYFLETDSTWQKELFIFPIGFARDIDYKGLEDARFPKGWREQDSPNFWSYTFVWNIEHNEAITEKELETDLQKYFNGLMRWKKTSVEITKEKTVNDIIKYTGAVKTLDNFFTKKPMTLNVKIEKKHCEAQKRSIISFQFSPQQFGHDVWKKLAEVKMNPVVEACGETKAKKIHDLMNISTKYEKFNGSVLVAEKGEVIYKNGFGLSNMEFNIRNKTNTKHRLASISKQFTAMLIVQLVAEGKLKLNVPISTYLPDYPKANGDKITLHHLLTHTSGIPNYTSFPNYGEIMRTPHTPMDLLKLFQDKALDFKPGASFSYSNSGYVLLGFIAEQITGKTYEQALKDKIFSPLGMNNTGYDNYRTMLRNRASGYDKQGNTFKNASYIDMSVAYAAGALYSTVEDLHLWDRALYTEQLIPKKYMDLVFEKHTSAWGNHYGYGWEIGKMRIGNTQNQSSIIAHSGGVNGFNTKITRFTSNERVVILLNNTGEAPLYDLTKAINGILNNTTYTLPRKSLANSVLEVVEKDGIEAGLSFYEKFKKDEKYHLHENEMNLAGYHFLQSDRAKAAAAIFKINIEAFPNSFNVYDSYGEALLALGDTTLAIKNYKKSIQLNPDNNNGIKVLQGLGVKTEDLIIKVPIEHLKLLAGEYKAIDKDWKIIIEEKNGKLFGNDGGYRYNLNPIGNDQFINPDDGATVVFDAKDKKAITFLIFGKVTFKKIK